MGDAYDRQAWGRYIRMLSDRTGWTVTRLAREAGFSPSTLHDWMSPTGRKAVTIPSILAIARAAGEDPIDTFRAAAGLTTIEPEDAEIATVLNAIGLTDEDRDDIIAGIVKRRERDRKARMEDTIDLIQARGGRVA